MNDDNFANDLLKDLTNNVISYSSYDMNTNATGIGGYVSGGYVPVTSTSINIDDCVLTTITNGTNGTTVTIDGGATSNTATTVINNPVPSSASLETEKITPGKVEELLEDFIKKIESKLEEGGISIDKKSHIDKALGWICIDNLSFKEKVGSISEALYDNIRNPYFFLNFDKDIWFGEIKILFLNSGTGSSVIMISPNSPEYFKKEKRIINELNDLLEEL